MMRTGSAQILPPLTSPTKASLQKPIPTKTKSSTPSVSTDSFNLQLKNLDKYIRSNDVATILKDTRSLVSQKRDGKDILGEELRDAHANLIYLRKKCDDVSETCLKKENEINKFRVNIEAFKEKELILSENTNNNVTKLQQLKAALELQSNKIDDAVETRRVYSRMLERLKKDRITDQIKLSQLESQVNDKLTQLSWEIQHATRAKQFEFQTKIVFDGVLRQVEHEDRQRQESLSVFEKTMLAQEEAEQKRAERIARNQAVAENAFSDFKNSNTTKWRELHLAHKFVSFFLKAKIEREIRQYEDIEKAYQKIKASTGLSDMREIVTKFVNREQTYSELLISIADHEKKIADHRKTNEHLKSSIQALKDDNIYQEKLREERSGLKSELLEAYRKLGVVSDSYQNTKLRVEKTYGWVVQTLIKLNKAKKNPIENYYETLPKDNVGAIFLNVIDIVKGELEAIQAADVEQVLDEIDNTKLDDEVINDDFVSKNIRVKPSGLRYERQKTSESALISRRSLQPEAVETQEREEDEVYTEEQDNMEAQRSMIRHKVVEDAIKAKKNQEKKDREDTWGR